MYCCQALLPINAIALVYAGNFLDILGRFGNACINGCPIGCHSNMPSDCLKISLLMAALLPSAESIPRHDGLQEKYKS